MTSTSQPLPFVCDMTAAADSPQERLAEYRRLFEHALVARARTADTVVWRFAASPDVEAWVRDLAAREAACCPFMAYAVTLQDGHVVFEIGGRGDLSVQPVLDMVQALPDELASGVPGLLDRLASAGLEIRTGERRGASVPDADPAG